MERRANAPHGRGYDLPSFSSTLLDAIYRSIDDEVDGRGAARDRGTGEELDATSPPVAAPKKVITSTTIFNKESAVRKAAAPAPASERTEARRRGWLPPISTSSSSDNSSYGGFSSSEPESVTAGRFRHVRSAGSIATVRSSIAPSRPPALVLSRSIPPLLSPAEATTANPQEKKSNSLKSKLRDLRKSKGPASPGARLAGFLNALFASGGSPRKSKNSPVGGVGNAAAVSWDESACSTASLHSRSCLSKTPSSRGAREEAVLAAKRSVRLQPMGVLVDENLRPKGQNRVSDSHRTALQQPTATSPAKRTPAKDGRREWETKMRVEELLRGLEDEDDDESDSSSDLFELEIRVGGVGAGLSYRDELPVYGTTHRPLGTHRPVSNYY